MSRLQNISMVGNYFVTKVLQDRLLVGNSTFLKILSVMLHLLHMQGAQM